MAISVPGEFEFEPGQYANEINLTRIVKAVSLLTLLRNATHVYASTGRRAVLARAWDINGTGLVTTAGALEVVLRQTAKLGARRDTIKFHVYEANTEGQITIRNAADSATLGGPWTWTGGVAATSHTGSVTLATYAEDVIVKVEALHNGTTADGNLWIVQAIEDEVVAADLPG
jgi:hypothetical protein